MAVTIQRVREYLNMPPDAADTVAELCLTAAKSRARTAGIPDFKNNAQYDLFLCALAGCWYDNRNFSFVGQRGNSSEAANVTMMINQFVLELRHATEDAEPEAEGDGNE